MLSVFADVPAFSVQGSELAAGLPFVELAIRAGLAASKGEATRLISQGGLYLNEQRVTDARGRVTLNDAIDGQVLLLRKGARERRLGRVS
jgi:tyrosyl-tRNA synthetase